MNCITEMQKNIEQDRAVQLESGSIPLQGSNVLLGLQDKPDPMLDQRTHALVANWPFAQLLGTHKLVGVYTVDTSTPTDKKIWSFVHTFDNVMDLHFRTLKSYFRLWRWTLNFEFEFKSVFQQVGQLLIVNHTIPQVMMDVLQEGASLTKDYGRMIQLPHRIIMMGEDTKVFMSLKWNAPVEATFATKKNYINPALPKENYLVPYDMGEIFLIAPYSMEVAQGVTPSMTVRIYSWLSDVGMSAYSPQDSLL